MSMTAVTKQTSEIPITGNHKNAKKHTKKTQPQKAKKVPQPSELTEAEYHAALERINKLTGKSSEHLTPAEFAEIRTLALIAQAYEQRRFVIPPPRTFAGLLERRMYELKLRQTELAQMLGISAAKLSLVLNGKQRPDVAMVKAVYENLSVDADVLLDVL